MKWIGEYASFVDVEGYQSIVSSFMAQPYAEMLGEAIEAWLAGQDGWYDHNVLNALI